MSDARKDDNLVCGGLHLVVQKFCLDKQYDIPSERIETKMTPWCFLVRLAF